MQLYLFAFHLMYLGAFFSLLCCLFILIMIMMRGHAQSHQTGISGKGHLAFALALYFSAALILIAYAWWNDWPARFLPAGLGVLGGVLFTLLRRNTGLSPKGMERWLAGMLCFPTIALTIASVILLNAFLNYEFRLEYVAQYSNLTLPLFYRITAFWAGQPGSLLFWAWAVAISGALFLVFPSYSRMGTGTKSWYALFFLVIMGFFMLLLACWSNPFTLLDFTPRDGNGLNPLLQNPGMIFHPPLLFLGYGGFVVPGCLALAQALNGTLYAPVGGQRLEDHWGQAARPFTLIAWSLLTAGIILGAWWAYMELGWGGYWAWDPVENASLIPWLVSTAYLHTSVIESRRGKLYRTNVFLMALTTISAFFATYLVRSGVVQSLHAFGDGGVGMPLLLFTLASLYFAAFVAICLPTASSKPLTKPVQYVFYIGVVLFALIFGYASITQADLPVWLYGVLALYLVVLLILGKTSTPEARALEDLSSKEGMLLIVAWLLLALSCIILVATLWPVIINGLMQIREYLPAAISGKLPTKPMGLEPAFYNRTCLPLFAAFAVLLVICPFRKWKGSLSLAGFSQPLMFGVALASALVIATGLGWAGITNPVALIAASCSLAAIIGIVLYFGAKPSLLQIGSSVAAHGVHIGLLMVVLGVAFSGPYQRSHTLELGVQETARIGEYTLRLDQLYEGKGHIGPDGQPNYIFIEAEVIVGDDSGSPIGILTPQRRLYSNFEKQTYAEVSTLFSLGTEIYATLLGIDEQSKATVIVNINPLVNWLWIGGTLMCLFPFFGLRRVRRLTEESGEQNGTPEPAGA